MSFNSFHIEPNTLIASGSGSALLGAKLFGVAGAIVGAIVGISVGVASEVVQKKRKKREKEPIS